MTGPVEVDRTQQTESPAAAGQTVRLRKGERTKRSILDATRKVLADQGYYAARIEDITRAANVAKGTFYLYFKNKKDATIAVMSEFIADGERAALGSRTVDDPFLEILEPTVAYTRIVFAHSGLLRAFVQFSHDNLEAAHLWSEVTRRWLTRVDAVMDRRLGKGRTDATTRTLVVHAMSWMVDGVLLSFLTRDHPRLQEVVRSPEQLGETLSVLWYRAVYGEDPNPAQLANGRPVLDFHFPQRKRRRRR
jgi:TetR/AcrR family transcriptional regulator, transcriptional repressor for nem operon